VNKQTIMKAIIIIAIIGIPVMYSGFYLKAFWDPYGNIEGVPVAIVNQDKGKENENLGKELEKKLIEKHILDFQVVDAQTAEKGLKEKQYYAVITIPEDFSESLKSAETQEKKQAIITYEPNQKSNFLASQIISKVVTSVQSELTGQVNEEVVTTLANNIKQVPEKMEDIQGAIQEVQDGNQKLGEGLQTLQNGTSELHQQYQTFDQGIQTANSGSKELTQGAKNLENGLASIQAGSNQLAQGAQALTTLETAVGQLYTKSTAFAQGMQTYTQGVDTLNTNIGNLLTGILQYAQANPEILADTNFQVLYGTAKAIQNSGKIEEIQTAGETLNQSATAMNQGIQTLAEKTEDLSTMKQGLQTLNQAIETANQGSSSLVEGSKNLQEGLSTLKTGSAQVKQGISSLNNGATQLVNGNAEMEEGLTTFKQEVQTGIEETKAELPKLEGLSDLAKEPVSIQEKDYGKIDNYGVSFAPYFMSISLWVGALMSFVVFYYDYGRRFKILGKGAKHKNIRNLCYLLIAVAQAIVLGSVLKAVLGLEPASLKTYYGTCILVSLVFTSMIQLMITQLGDVGKFLAVLLLVLQLAASGGTFPIETEPSFFQAIYPYMPMTYTLNLFKEAIIMREPGLIAHNVIALFAIFAIFLIATIVLQIFKKGRETVEKVKRQKNTNTQ